MEIDTLSELVSGSIPFDQNFIIKKIYSTDIEPLSFEVYEINKDGSERKTPTKRVVNNYLDFYEYRRPRRWRYKNKKPNSSSFSDDSAKFKKYKTQMKNHFGDSLDFTQELLPLNLEHNFNKIKLSPAKQAVYYYVPQLNPGREYRFTFINSNNGLIKQLYSAGNDLSNNKPFKALERFNDSKIRNDANTKDKRWLFGKFDDFETFIKTSRIRIPNIYLESEFKTDQFDTTGGRFYLCERSDVHNIAYQKVFSFYFYKELCRYKKRETAENSKYNEFDLILDTARVDLRDTYGRKIIKDSVYHFLFQAAGSAYFSAPSRAYKFDGSFFEPDPSDTNETHVFPLELIPSPHLNFQSINRIINSVDSNLSYVKKLSDDRFLKRIVRQAYVIDCSSTSNLKDLICKNPKGFNLSIQKVLNYEPFGWDRILKGHLPLNYAALDKAASEDAYSDRSKNLDTTIQFVAQLMNLAEILEANESTSYDSLQLNLNTLKKQLEGNKVKLDAAHTKQLAIKTAINDQDYVHSASHHAGTTDVFEFRTRNTFRIVPDFGFIGVWRGTSAVAISDFTPYLGFHINLRPINKDVPFRLVRYKTILHYLSVMSGVTLTSLKIPGQREDLFANFSLLTGVGFRLNNVVKMTGGTVWFKAMDPNPGIDRKRLAFSPYAGVSLDLDLQQLFGGIAKLFN